MKASIDAIAAYNSAANKISTLPNKILGGGSGTSAALGLQLGAVLEDLSKYTITLPILEHEQDLLRTWPNVHPITNQNTSQDDLNIAIVKARAAIKWIEQHHPEVHGNTSMCKKLDKAKEALSVAFYENNKAAIQKARSHDND